jgi:pimeloyl-ACP methyl ester carboxylesterase
LSRPPAAQPIVLLGGFLSFPAAYAGMRAALERVSGQPVWVTTVSAAGWAWVLRRLGRTVQMAAAASATGRVTLIGHSSGGVMARLYLGEEPFEGERFEGRRWVDTLYTLGSPHYNRRGARLRKLVEARYPGAYFAPEVRYVAVMGRAIEGRRHGTAAEQRAAATYAQITEIGEGWGDGLVPEASGLLKGAEHITLPGVYHYGLRGERWYGAPDVVAAWWGN